MEITKNHKIMMSACALFSLIVSFVLCMKYGTPWGRIDAINKVITYIDARYTIESKLDQLTFDYKTKTYTFDLHVKGEPKLKYHAVKRGDEYFEDFKESVWDYQIKQEMESSIRSMISGVDSMRAVPLQGGLAVGTIQNHVMNYTDIGSPFMLNIYLKKVGNTDKAKEELFRLIQFMSTGSKQIVGINLYLDPKREKIISIPVEKIPTIKSTSDLVIETLNS